MKMKILIAASIAACLTSCAIPQPAAPPIKFLTRSRVEHFIVKGRTTKAAVIAEFGFPGSEVVTSSSMPGVPHEILTYTKVYFAGEIAMLMVQVDERGIVSGYTFSGTGPLTQG